ncbi:uncharacterized protein N0V89_003202 [Didymosphaeria variabile]|uniref:DUF7703 domain-containing protein n=1 Tax=Didymosphaeria variabile TaxID=1932322 RepID=A0A9W8XUY1_9PLEO|nr:uncharacterized protein N0V89_003202 [Didymosphaeria variabile]KAJ4358618.1 hypothetical protein N0V89_003202 [Didymosphaeria variabile]
MGNDSGMSRNHFESWNAEALAVVICSALALYNALELELLILTTFHAYRGLYFWSLALASFGVIPYVLGFMIEYFELSYLSLGTAIDTFGWALMVTGQSVVLYSRLWLVFGNGHKRLLQLIKWTIIFNGCTFHGLTAIVVYGSRFGSATKAFSEAYNVIERIQMCVFFLQEVLLSGIYIWKALDIIQTSDRKRSHHTMWQLFSINVIIIALDIALLALEFSGLHVAQQTIKGLIYCVKLKLELAILNKLVDVSTVHARANALTLGNTNDFLDPTKTVWDITRFTPAFSSSMHTYPKWVQDLEKSGLRASYSPTDSTWAQAQKRNTSLSADDSYFSAEVQPCTTLLDPRLEGRDRGSATDLLYADAVRKLTNPG